MIFGVDYVSGPTVAALKAAGVRFVCRYLSTPGNPKNLRPAEAAELHRAGIAIVLVFETTADRAKAGSDAGVHDARSARAQASACGVPSSTPIYFAVDFDASERDQYAINAYLRGAAEVLGKDKTGVYGGFYVVKRAMESGACRWGWQTYAWSGGQWYPRAQLRQYSNGHTLAGASVDYDHAVVENYGQWRPGSSWRWVVSFRAADGSARIARTISPGIWAARHPRTFRHGDVHFDRRRR